MTPCPIDSLGTNETIALCWLFTAFAVIVITVIRQQTRANMQQADLENQADRRQHDEDMQEYRHVHETRMLELAQVRTATATATATATKD